MALKEMNSTEEPTAGGILIGTLRKHGSLAMAHGHGAWLKQHLIMGHTNPQPTVAIRDQKSTLRRPEMERGGGRQNMT